MRAKQTDEEKEAAKKKNRENMNAKRSNLTAEEREQIKEKDRIRKAKMREKKKEEMKADLRIRKKKGEFAHKGEYLLAKDKRFTQFGRTSDGWMEKNKGKYDGNSETWLKSYNKVKQRYWRKGRPEYEVEYYMIEELLSQRRRRQLRNGKEHLLDNLAATRGMRLSRVREFMRRKARDKDEEVVWQMFWKRGDEYKRYLDWAKPDMANLFREKEENDKKKKEEREIREKELDEQGRWNYDNARFEYVWSIPDESGHHMTLAEYNKEDEEVPLTIEEQLQRARANRDPEEEAKWDRDQEAYAHIFRELYDYDNEVRRRKRKEKQEELKEKLSTPISIPDSGEKSEYEKIRDENIKARHQAMKESGMFSDCELDKMLKSKLKF